MVYAPSNCPTAANVGKLSLANMLVRLAQILL